MYGDTEVMRTRSAQLREQSADLRAMADQLVARTETVRWSGRAAASLDERIRERATYLRDVASRHDTAADTLSAHLREVDRLKEAIADAERRRRRSNAPDPSDDARPPTGHKDWLASDLPGR